MRIGRAVAGALILSLGVILGCGGGLRADGRPPDLGGQLPAAVSVGVDEAGLAGVPRLVVGASVGADFEALALETWDRFLETFWARRDCFGDVRLEAAYDLDSRAGYDPETAMATVRVPGTAAMLQSGLIHEWAHHVEFQCAAHQQLRAAFLAAQGLPPDTPWRADDPNGYVAAGAWAEIPSEQYAEAVVELVLGGRPIATAARVSPAAIEVVAEWARGE